jgi:hypothetical protein
MWEDPLKGEDEGEPINNIELYIYIYIYVYICSNLVFNGLNAIFVSEMMPCGGKIKATRACLCTPGIL